jgi:hypothetical protein
MAEERQKQLEAAEVRQQSKRIGGMPWVSAE